MHVLAPEALMRSPLFIFVPANPGEHRFYDLWSRQHLTVYRESAVAVAVVLLTTALVLVVALLTAAGACKLARMDGATYPAALTRGATAFAVTAALAALFT
ncbi:hypothetical protein [Streptomyces sp. NPDC046197]|uniref:hypothetical protein n=1 Tax=Streptomyces sp. NPDC046197 TaxID=3154337 RepID=UPI0033C8746E